MDGIVSATMGMQAEALQRNLSYALLSKAMNNETMMAAKLLEELPQVAPVMPGEVGFNLDVFG